jgi:hypothetical protein
VGPRAGLDDVEKRKSLTLPGLELRPLGREARSQSLFRLVMGRNYGQTDSIPANEFRYGNDQRYFSVKYERELSLDVNMFRDGTKHKLVRFTRLLCVKQFIILCHHANGVMTCRNIFIITIAVHGVFSCY